MSATKVRIKFQKQGAMKFIGHLDIMRYFQKAIRRAGIDIAFTEGFSPHMVMSFALPLGVGLTSSGEYLDIEVKTPLPSKEAVERLNAVMVDGMKVISFRQIPEDKSAKAMSLVCAADYTVAFRPAKEPPDGWQGRLSGFLSQERIPVLKKTKKSEKEEDIKPMIYEAKTSGDGLFLKLAAGSAANLKPELFMEAFASCMDWNMPPFSLLINREELYANVPGKRAFVSLEKLGEEISG